MAEGNENSEVKYRNQEKRERADYVANLDEALSKVDDQSTPYPLKKVRASTLRDAAEAAVQLQQTNYYTPNEEAAKDITPEQKEQIAETDYTIVNQLAGVALGADQGQLNGLKVDLDYMHANEPDPSTNVPKQKLHLTDDERKQNLEGAQNRRDLVTLTIGEDLKDIQESKVKGKEPVKITIPASRLDQGVLDKLHEEGKFTYKPVEMHYQERDAYLASEDGQKMQHERDSLKPEELLEKREALSQQIVEKAHLDVPSVAKMAAENMNPDSVKANDVVQSPATIEALNEAGKSRVNPTAVMPKERVDVYENPEINPKQADINDMSQAAKPELQAQR